MPTWRFMGFYGTPEKVNRRESWELRRLRNNSNLPCLVMRDFNEILCSFEKKGGRLHNIGNMIQFHQTLDDCELFDLGFAGR